MTHNQHHDSSSGRANAAMPRLRDALRDVPAYVPGRLLDPVDGQSWKLSSNENPYPPLPEVLAAMRATAEDMNRYPDLASTVLTNEMAARLGIAAGHLAWGAGSSSLLQQLVQICVEPGDEVIYPWRSFESYPIITRLAGGRPVQIPLAIDETPDLEAMAAAVTDRTRLVFVCTPNNPTGTALHHAQLDTFLDRVPSDVLVAIDEAYLEFVTHDDPVDAVTLYRSRPNVVVLRTFSKAYGLAGLRLGYAVAQEPVAAALRQAAVPFGVSAMAQSAGLASLRSHEQLMQRVDDLVRERGRVRDALLEQGWTVPESQANFVWLRLGQATEAFASACQQVGVAVRAYGQEGVRITIGERPANDTMLTVARTLIRRFEHEDGDRHSLVQRARTTRPAR